MSLSTDSHSVLVMDASNSFVLAGLFTDDGRSFQRRLLAPRDSFTKLLPLIQELLQESETQKPRWICATVGPGSFTGTRITAGTARNLAQLWDIPVLGVDSLAFYGHSVIKKLNTKNHTRAAFLLDAKQKKAYTRIFNTDQAPENYSNTELLDINPAELLELLDQNDIIYGDDPETLIAYAAGENENAARILSERIQKLPEIDAADLYEFALISGGIDGAKNWMDLLPIYARTDPAHAKYPDGFNRKL